MPLVQALPDQVELTGSALQEDLEIALEAETLAECRAVLKRARLRIGSLVQAAAKARAETVEMPDQGRSA